MFVEQKMKMKEPLLLYDYFFFEKNYGNFNVHIELKKIF